MPHLRSVDVLFLNDLFEMGSGYVLNFSNATFGDFFREEVGIDIDDSRYDVDGTSKAKRLRYFLRTADAATAVRALEALWEYREALRRRARKPESIEDPQSELSSLIARLQGKGPSTPHATAFTATGVDRSVLTSMRSELVALSSLEPQTRGYEFEKFLKRFFDASGLAGRDPFRLRGEQIDGSFLLRNEIYLLEAKWQSAPCGAEDLHAFHGKVEQKAAWARGLFISNSGFTEDGLIAFGRGKRVICMDGLDLYDILDRAIPLGLAFDLKVRRAGETGLPFLRIRDLFPT
jgi:hypothetical protein